MHPSRFHDNKLDYNSNVHRRKVTSIVAKRSMLTAFKQLTEDTYEPIHRQGCVAASYKVWR